VAEEQQYSNVAVLLPAYNEEAEIQRVVRDFRASLPGAMIYVYDNNSSDKTKEKALLEQAVVRTEYRQGKGYVVRRMFSDIDADIYLMCDGDGTYDASIAPELIRALLDDNLDMVVATRTSTETDAYRRGHRFGNWLLNRIVRLTFGRTFSDMLSGYRVLSRRFVKSFPSFSGGFEIETEITVHALEMDMPTRELATEYTSRSEGSSSKLNTYSDGLQILWMIMRLLKAGQPFVFFGWIAVFSALVSLLLAWPIFETYLETGLVPKIPTAVLSASLMIISVMSLFSGVILENVSQAARESKRLHYLSYLAPTHHS
jgi:glycosyltransferase involved in cell wall biosynthesis